MIAEDVHAAALNVLAPMLPPADGSRPALRAEHFNLATSAENSTFDVLHTTHRRQRCGGCHITTSTASSDDGAPASKRGADTAPSTAVFRPSSPASNSAPVSSWQMVCASLLATRFPCGRATSAEPQFLPSLSTLMEEASVDVELARLLARTVDARFAPTGDDAAEEPPAVPPEYPQVVTLDVVGASLYGRKKQRDILSVTSHVFVDASSFGSHATPDKRFALTSGRWGARFLFQ